MTITDQTKATVLGAYAREQTDVVRFLMRRTVDTCTAVELLVRNGTAGIDQAAAAVRDLREELFSLADARLPGEQLMAYGDGSPITDNHRTAAGQIARRYLQWPQQIQIQQEGATDDDD